jgi:imidazolonepropionase
MAMAARYLRLSPAEALAAATRNAAYACGLGERVGRIQEGFAADLLLLEGDDYRDLCYGFGGAPRLRLMIGGRWRG